MEITDIMAIVKELPNPELGDIGRLLFVQGAIMQKIGLEMLRDATEIDPQKKVRRIASATSILNGAESALNRAASIIEKQPSAAAFEQRQKLLQTAFDNGYDIAFEADGRVVLELERYGNRHQIGMSD